LNKIEFRTFQNTGLHIAMSATQVAPMSKAEVDVPPVVGSIGCLPSSFWGGEDMAISEFG